jgi:iron:rusticyanin reductase
MSTLKYRRIRQFVGICCLLGFALPASAVPSFARQTGMACAACHTVFPELTPFGREFKLNGYVIDNIKQITGISADNRHTLALNSIPPLSVMLEISYARTAGALPDSVLSGVLAKDGDVLFPQQASLFYAGKIRWRKIRAIRSRPSSSPASWRGSTRHTS